MKDGLLFSFSDVRGVFLRKRRSILVWGCFFALFCFSVLVVQKPVYGARAVFYDGVTQDDNLAAKNAMALMGFKVDSSLGQTPFFLKTFPILRPVVEKFGLQAQAKTSFFKRIFNNLKRGFGFKVKEDGFLFTDVFCERGASFYLKFYNRESFDILNLDKKIIERDSIHFNLKRVPKQFEIGKLYRINIAPLNACVKELSKKLVVEKDKESPNFINLSLNWRSFNSAEVLNAIMYEYVNYLKKDLDEMTERQLSYLGKRESNLKAKMEKELDESFRFMQDNFGGMPGKEVIKLYIATLGDYEKKILVFDLEQRGIEDLLAGRLGNIDDPKLCEMKRELKELQYNKESFDLAINFNPSRKNLSLKESMGQTDSMAALFERGNRELDEIRNLKKRTEVSLASLDKNDAVRYLKNYLHLLNVKEKTLEDNLLNGDKIPAELEGIGLEAANSLYLKCGDRINEVQSEIKELLHLSQKVKEDGFQFSSLLSFLNDPISQEIVTSASHKLLFLKDERYVGEKEKIRIEEELKLQKDFLSGRLKDSVALKKIDLKILEERLKGLQILIRDRLNMRISLSEQYAEDYLRQKREDLIVRRAALEGMIEKIKDKLSDLSKKRVKERMSKFGQDLNLAVFKGLAQIIETKTVSANLMFIKAKPFELATENRTPISLNLFRYPVGAAFLGMILVFFSFLIQALFKGFELSKETLSYLGLRSFEKESESFLFLKDVFLVALIGKKEFVRKICLFLQSKGKRVLVGSFEKEEFDHFLISEKSFWDNSFLKNLENAKKNYDIILLSGNFKIGSIEARHMIATVERAIYQINGETKKEIERVEYLFDKLAFAVDK